MITGILEIQGQVRGVLAEHSAGAVSVFGAWIRLPEERWQHIVREHPELEGLHQEVLVTVESPLKVLSGSHGELLAVREMILGKFLVVFIKKARTAVS